MSLTDVSFGPDRRYYTANNSQLTNMSSYKLISFIQPFPSYDKEDREGFYKPFEILVKYIGSRYINLQSLNLVVLDNLKDDDSREDHILNETEWGLINGRHYAHLDFLEEFLETCMLTAITKFKKLKFYSVD
jgi:hypothetical protein